MTEKADIEALADAMRRADAQGNFQVELDAGSVLCLIAAVQLANRHPVGRHTFGVKRAVQVAKKLCERGDARDPEFGRFLERGWHEAFDVRAGQGEGGGG